MLRNLLYRTNADVTPSGVREADSNGRYAFTLIELLIAIGIIAILLLLMLPAISATRESARRMQCASNQRQVALGVLGFEAAVGRFPASWTAPASADIRQGAVDGWSTHALILPFLEEQVVRDKLDFNASFDENFAPIVSLADGAAPISAVRIPVFLCPSEARDEVRFENGVAKHYPLNYGVNLGEWFVWDPSTGEGGNGAFYPMSKLNSASFRDGLSRTLMLAEVRAWTPYFRNAGYSNLDRPKDVATIVSLGGDFKTESGHTEWVDGRAHQVGMTTLFTPNANVIYRRENVDYDVDWNNQQEGISATLPTFAAITSRSYHPGVVVTSRMDGSQHNVTNNIDNVIWRQLSTRIGDAP